MKIGVYIHIPFCKSKCLYCDFASFTQDCLYEAYINALEKEIVFYAKKLKTVSVQSIFIGGGTPTVLSPFLMDKLFQTLTQNFSFEQEIEWTIEANPGTITKEQIDIFKKYGVNRVSLGLQAVQEPLLRKLGRIHSFKQWGESLELLRQAGINNINTDLMFALPDQSIKEWEETLKTVCSYNVQHISAYALIVEEGTPFYDLHEKGKLNLPSEEVDRQMYEKAKSYLKNQGYTHYEISNWTKARKACKHNLIYWTQKPYIGLGLGAHSYFEYKRYHNTYDLEEYIQKAPHTKQDVEESTLKMQMEEYMFLRLRLIHGIHTKDFYKNFGVKIEDVYAPQLKQWIKTKALIQTNDRIYLSDYGIDISNSIFSSFL